MMMLYYYDERITTQQRVIQTGHHSAEWSQHPASSVPLAAYLYLSLVVEDIQLVTCTTRTTMQIVHRQSNCKTSSQITGVHQLLFLIRKYRQNKITLGNILLALTSQFAPLTSYLLQ